MPDANNDLPAIYALRIGEKAADDIVAVRERFADLEGADIGLEWQAGLFGFLATLARFPRRYPTAPEQRKFSYEVRNTHHRRTPVSAAYRIIFTIVDSAAANKIGEAQFVLIMALRHGAAREITRADVKAIEAQTSLLPPPKAN